MKRLQRLKFVSIIVVCVLVLISFHQPIKAASNKTVFVPDNFPTIQAAINSASPGTTIVVRDGFYRENLIIDIDKNDLVIKSEHGPKNTIICNTGNESDAYIVEIHGDRILFEGFTITNDKDVLAHGMKIISRNSIIKSNIISPKGVNINTAIVLEQCRAVTIENNTLRETYHGIVMSRSGSCRIVNNLIIGMSGYGIYLQHNNNWNVIEGNDISSCMEDGIRLKSASYTKIVWNVITGCKGSGIRVESPMNEIYLNNFVANNQHVAVQSANTTWNSEPLDYMYDLKRYHGCLGNFWDDYKGVDNNQDGVGDTPYKISEAQYDRYPLMQLIKFYKIITSTTTTYSPTTTTTYTPTTSTTTQTPSTTPTVPPTTTSSQTITSPPQPTVGGLEVIIVVIIVAVIISLIVFSKVRKRH